MLTNPIIADAVVEFAADVSRGLTKRGQKELPSKYFYDTVGSRLFEVICDLPEYGLTRADERLLRAYARKIVELVPGPVVVAELGSGSGKKTRWILEALSRHRQTFYYPIEISAAALAMCRRELSDMDAVSIVGFEREYLDGLLEVAARRQHGQRILVLFLGSTIGNFDPPADVTFLRELRLILQTGDALLLGTDLEKSIPRLIQAYDDPLGVTAAFNLNLLTRINRELDADFIVQEFQHEARFNFATRSIEMHLRATRDQVVTIRGAGISVPILENETIWTETCRKFTVNSVTRMAREAGFRCEAQWIDDEWPFAENLLIAD
jgi:dimethylhistidine N-methyltransferase